MNLPPRSSAFMRLLPLILLASLLTSAAGAKVTETIRQTHPLAADGVVSLTNVNGSICISAWNRDEVAIKAVKKAPDAAALARIHVTIDARPQRLVITTTHEKHGLFGHETKGEVDYTLQVPVGATLRKIDSVNSGVTVIGVHGAVVVHLVNGGIRVEDLTGSADLHSVNGGVQAAFSKVPPDVRVSMATVNGGCVLDLPPDAGARIDAHTVNGGLHSDLPLTLRDTGHHTLRGTIGKGGAEFTLRTVNGGITIRNR